MEIKFNSNVVPVTGPARKSPPASAVGSGQAGPSFSGADALNQALQLAPETRTAAVQRAKELVSQNDYPPPELINGIANLLASKIAAEFE